MADDLQQNPAGADSPVVPRLPEGAFEGVLTALAGGADAEEALAELQATVRQSVLDAGGTEGAADYAAGTFIDTFRGELFEGSRPLTDAADYAGQAMQTAIDTYDPDARTVDPSDVLLAAIASGRGVEEAVSRVVAEMGGDLEDADSGRVEDVFLDELQSALSRGESPDAAVAAASQAAETGLQSLKQAEVPVDNPVLSALAGGQNVDEALTDAAQRSGGDADAFLSGLENSLADGTDANQAVNDAQQSAVDTAQARQNAEVELGAADQLAAALASGEEVYQALEQTGGGDAFASALEDALANGAGAGDAMNQAGEAQARQDAVAQEQSVPLSPADQLAASLASGDNVDQVMQAAGGDENFAAALEQSLADGAAPGEAMASGQQASENAQTVAQQQSVPLSPADQLAASLASGEDVGQALENAGGGEAFGAELEASLASGETPDQSMAEAGVAQQSAETMASQQEVPADPAVQALAQGGDAAAGQNVADAVAEVTGTTGDTPSQTTETAAPTQTAETPAEQPAQQAGETQTSEAQAGETQAGETQAGESQGEQPAQQQATATEPQDTPAESSGDETPQQTASQEPAAQEQAAQEPGTDSEQTETNATEPEQTQTAQSGESEGTEQVAESVDDVVETPAGQTPTDGTPGDDAETVEEDVTQTIQTASGDAADDNEISGDNTGDDGTGDDGTGTTLLAQGGGSDQPTEEEIRALQEIATASGGNTGSGTSSNLSYNQLLNPTIGNSGLGGSSNQSTTQTTTQTTTSRQTQKDDKDNGSTVIETTEVTPNSAPVAANDSGTSQENAVLTVKVTANDSDPDSDALNVTAASVGPNSGTVSFSGGSITFDPGTDFDYLAVGEDRDVQISYTVADNSGATDTAVLTVRVTGTNDAPTVSQPIDGGTTNEDAAPIQFSLLSVASDVDASDDLDTDSVVITASDSGTRPVIVADIDNDTGVVTIPSAQFGDLAVGESVVLSVTYNVIDGNGGIVANTATVTVEGRNDAPQVVGIVRQISEDVPSVSVQLLGFEVFDEDVSDVLSAQSLTQTQGRNVGATIDANGHLIFAGGQFEDLNDGDREDLVFTYEVFDGTTTTTNTVTVTMFAANDVPVAVVDTAAGTENQSLTIDVLANDTDLDADDGPPNFTLLTAEVDGTKGSASVVGNQVFFDPGSDFDDLDVGDTATVTINYTMQDDSGAQASSTVTVTVTGTNDTPTVSSAIDAGTTHEDAVASIQIALLSVANDLDESHDLDTDSVVVTSSDGRPAVFSTVDNDTGNLVIDPAQFGDLAVGESVILTVNYNVVDEHGASVANTAAVTVEGRNDAPQVVGIVRTVSEDAPSVTVQLLGLEVFDEDISDALSAVSLSQTGGRNVGASIDANGNLVFAGGQFEDLDDGESEVLTFTYDVSDGTTTTQNTVSVTIAGSNDAPTVSAIATTRGEDSGAVSVGLLAGQTDVDVETLSAVSLSQTGGRNVGASIDANGNLVFAGGQFENLDDGESEVLTFTYDVSDGTTTTQNTVSVTITGSNDAPTVSAIATTRGEDSGAVSVDLLAGQTDVDVETLSAVSLSQTGGRNVGASIDANGNLVFAGGQFENLDDGESEVLTFTYDVSDGTTTTQNTVSVTITGSNDAPTVSAIATTRGEDSGAVSVDLLAGQTDIDVEALSAESLSQTGGRNVNASIDANGNLVFAGGQFEDLDDGESEVLTFTYDVSDGTTTTQNTVSVTITGSNDGPELIVPGALSTSGAGTNGNDASFSYAEAANFDTFPTQSGTIETWVKTTDTNGALLSYAVPNSPNELWITLNNGNLQVWLNNGNQGSVNAGNLTDGEWHHVALSFGSGGGDTVLYIDGSPALNLGSTAALTSGGTLVMGSDQDVVGGSFESGQALQAEFDGLRLWNGVRSEADILATMSAALDPIAHPDLVADYSFDGTLESSVPGAPTLTLNNAEIGSGDALQSGVEDTAIPLTGIVVADADGDVLTVTLTSVQGSLTANPGFGGATVQAVANGISITGTPADVQAAMGTATFTGAPDFFGTADVTVSVDDGTAPTETRTVEVTVTPGNDAPDILGVTGHSALALDGNDGRVEIADVPDFTVGGNSPITVEMWLNPDNVSGLTTIFDKSDRSQADYSTYRMHIIDGTIGLWNGATSIPYSGPIVAGQWQHVAFTFDGTTMNAYIDGQLTASAPFTLGSANSDPWTIGDDVIAGRNFDGLIDDVRVWNTARSQAEIQASMNGELAEPWSEPGLVMNLSFDGADGATVTDATGHGNDGTMSGGASIAPGVGVYATVSNAVSLEAGSVLQGTIVAGDADGDALSYSLSADGGHGTAVVNADGTYSYTPNPGFSGVDAFAVRVADGNGGETFQQISVTVTLPNMAPVIAGEATNVSAVADFNGADAYIDVPDATVNGLTAGTIETWIYLDTNDQEAIFTQQANGVNSLAIFRIGDGTPGQVMFQGSNQSGTVTSNTNIPTGEWHHVAITFDDTQANLYIDGQHDASLAGNFSIVGASGGQITGTAIGAWLGHGNGRHFDGQMSEFRIWDHVRTDTEIADNYQANLAGDEAGLRALYNFTDGFAPGEMVADATGNFDGVSSNVSATVSETMTFEVASEDFENGAAGWSNTTTTETATVQTDFMGAFGNGASTSKTFTLPAGASETTISFDFYKMDTWDGENFQIQIGGQTVATRSFIYNTNVASPVGGIDDTVAVTFSQGVNQGPGFNGGWDDHSFRVDMTLTQQQIAALPVDANGNPMLQLGFTSTLDQDISDESWGIDNLAIAAEIPVGGIEAGSGTLSSNLLSDASDPDGDVLTVSNAAVISSNGARTVSYTLDGVSGALSIDTAQFANLGAGQSEVVTVTYDVIDEHGAATTGSRSFTVHGTQNAVSLGTADYVEIDHHADLEPGAGDLTAEMWFYWPGAGGVSGLQFLMSKGNTDGSNDPGYSLFMNGNTLIARTSTGSGQGELELDMSGIDSGWHHVAMVVDQTSDPTDGQLTAYLDGSTAGWQIHGGGYDDVWTKGDISSASDPLMIGDPAHSPSAQGGGYTYPMDEVRIWDNARSEAQINQTMHQQLNGNEAGLAGYWTFNESVGTTVTDLTGNGHDGTMSADAERENLIELSISNNEVYKGLLMGSDAEGDQLSYSLAQGPQHGSVSFDGNTFVYDHDGSGSNDSFTVEISDGTDTVTEQIDVTVV